MKLFVGCGSSNSICEPYLSDCRALLKEVFQTHDLVFGASSSGIMGIAYEEAKKNQKRIIGICTDMWKEDLKELECTKEYSVPTILERTQKLEEESDVLLFLPGGIGTFVELFSAIDRKRNKEFDKPIIIYNLNHYYDSLLTFLEKNYEEGFTSKKVKECYQVTTTVKETLAILNKNF